jgi:hypothetical protein|tara:strand:- start:3746 stop:4495 length:750 start_codon:yes stop_codon:yes gene_type:complete
MQVYISKDNRQWGPYDAKQANFLIGKGSFTLQDWAWVEGGTEWIPVSQILEMLHCEEGLQKETTHQKVELAKEKWRSKLTSPASTTNEPVLVARAVHNHPVESTSAGGSWWKRNFFYPALGFGIAGFVIMLVLGGPDMADYNSLINEGGIAFAPDSEKPFDGKAVTLYPSGQLMYEAEYKDGRQHGTINSFFKDGAKQSEGTMENGVFHGKVIHYHPNGQMQSHYLYRKGIATSRKNWDETGKAVDRGE